MIKSVTVTNFLGESLKMTLSDPYDHGIYIQEITGLGPPSANINMTEISGLDGSMYNSARVDTRNVVLTLGFLPTPDVETVRHLTYKYFPIKKRLTLTIETDHRTQMIDGYVESNEPNIFSDQETAQISILCPSPYFYGLDQYTVFLGTTQSFEFPLYNEGMEPTIEMGSYDDNRYKTIVYRGDVDTGVVAMFHCLDTVRNITIFNRTTQELMYFSTDILDDMFGTSTGLITGDDLMISTIRGDKYVALYRDGVFYNVVNCLGRNTSWLTLVKGANVMAYTADYGIRNLEFKIRSNVLYEGI